MTTRPAALVIAYALGCDEATPPPADATPGADVTVADGCGSDVAPSAACPVCTPGALTCSDDGLAIERCAPDGLSFVVTARCDAAGGELCSEGRCVVPCAEAAATNSYQGCEFFAAGTLNSGLGRYFAGTTRDDFPFAVTVTNPWPVAVQLTLEGGGLGGPRTETVPARGARTITLPWVLPLTEGADPDAVATTLVPGGAVRLRASAPVGAWQFNPLGYVSADDCDGAHCFSYSNDASLLLPVASLRRQYMVVTRPTVRVTQRGETRWRLSTGFVTIVGTADSPTEVTVHLRGRTAAGAGIAEGAPGTELRQRLGRGDVLQLVSSNRATCAQPEPDTVHGDVFCRPVPDEDLTGTVVESSAPVAVFAGHDCALVPYNRYACDHLEEQMLPVEALGRRYVVARTPPVSGEPDLLRVVTTRPGTRLTFEPSRAHAEVTLAGVGDFVEFEQRESVAVTASEPVLVAQFLVGGDYDPDRPGEGRGDPDMVLMAPVDQTRPSYAFVAAPGFPEATAIATVPQGERLRLDGALIDLTPAATVAGYDVLYVRVLAGPHRLESLRRTVHFSLTVSGLATATSYTYPAGLDLAAISPPL